MTEVPLDLEFIKDYLSISMPQEWLICLSETTTCLGSGYIIRIESEPKPDKRSFICAIQIKPNSEPKEIIITTPDITSYPVMEIVRTLRQTTDFCLTLTECNLNCEDCPKTWDIYH